MAKFFDGRPRKLEDNDKEFLLTKIKPLLKQNNISEAREVIVEAKLRTLHDDKAIASMSRVQEFLLDKLGEDNYFRGGDIIMDNEFWACTHLEKIVVPEGIKEIGDGAFTDCTRLTFVNLPGSLKYLGEDIFCRCKNLTTVNIEKGADKSLTIRDAAFYDCPCKVYVREAQLVYDVDPEGFLIEHIHYKQ